MNKPSEQDELVEQMVEILPSGNVARRRTYSLAAIELGLYVATCHVIVLTWARFDGPPAIFGLLVACTLFGVNLLTGVYGRAVYVTHIRRLVRSGVAHGLSLVLLSLLCMVFSLHHAAVFFVLGMVLLSYVITNTLRPVLVEVIRAGNENEQRRQPAKSIS
ncbi:MAG: hypothetical protein ACPGSC_12355 [Granulosicoccaceae bacterium]